MLPTNDALSTISYASAASPVARLEAEKAAEAYRAKKAEVSTIDKIAAEKMIEASDESKNPKAEVKKDKDRVEINLALTREERDAFVSAFNNKQEPLEMTEEEKEALRNASERISKFIDEAIARNSDNRERVEKAVGEWYHMITKGEHQRPTELITLLRQAAMGNLGAIGEH